MVGIGSAGITGNLLIEDEETGLEFGHMSQDLFAMLFQYVGTLLVRRRAKLAQLGITNHVANWHARGFQAPEKFNPRQDGHVVIALAGVIALDVGQQSDPFVIADGIGRHTRTFCKFTDLHCQVSRHHQPKIKTSSALEVKRISLMISAHAFVRIRP